MIGRLSRDTKRRLLLVCLAGFALYGVLNVLAMIVYPGGTPSDPEARGYSFLDNFFSDLGMVRTYSGEANTASLLLFASALVLVGVVLVVFFLILAEHFPEPHLGGQLARAGTTAGVVSGACCVGVALTPWDQHIVEHVIFAYCLSLAFLTVAALYAAAILRNPAYPNGYAIVFGAYFAVLVAFIALMVLGPDLETEAGGRALAAGQKVCIYAGMACMALQVVGTYRLNRANVG
jgi:hypothetical membrane protein